MCGFCKKPFHDLSAVRSAAVVGQQYNAWNRLQVRALPKPSPVAVGVLLVWPLMKWGWGGHRKVEELAAFGEKAGTTAHDTKRQKRRLGQL
eukprot:3542040-Pleurochrysis_carterae.AAC.2